MSTLTEPTTWTHRDWTYHVTVWRCAPGYGAIAWCRECDWARSWGDYHGSFSGWRALGQVERACFDHEDTTREPLLAGIGT